MFIILTSLTLPQELLAVSVNCTCPVNLSAALGKYVAVVSELELVNVPVPLLVQR